MGVSYHIVPVNKETGKFENLFLITGKRINNEINKLGNVMIQFPERVLNYFEKDISYFDFIFSLKSQEISETTFEPEVVKQKLLQTIKTLETKDNFPINRYNYYRYEDEKDFTFLYVTLLGKELKKITLDDSFVDSEIYDINTSFDIFNNYNESGKQFYQWNKEVYVTDANNNRTTSSLNYDSFPSKIQIIKVERDYGFSKEIKEVSLILKKPFEHFEQELNDLIEICEECIKHNLGIKSYVSY